MTALEHKEYTAMRIFTFVLLLMMMVSPAHALEQEYHSSVRLISPVTATGQNDTVSVAVQVTLDHKWHTYWRTPGEAGLAPAFDWRGSQNIAQTKINWPVPYRFITYDIDNYGFKDQVTFPIDITLADPVAPLSVKLRLDLLVCDDICVPEVHQLSLDLPAGAAKDSAYKGVYDAALEKLPAVENNDFHFLSAWLDFDESNNNYLVVRAQSSKAPGKNVDLFVEHGSGAGFSTPRVHYDASAKILTLTAMLDSVDTIEKITGRLLMTPMYLTYTDEADAVEGELLLSPKPENSDTLSFGGESLFDAGFLRIVLFAFLGGLILNLMPCVLPVLSLKILKVLSYSGETNRRLIFKNFIASALGILTSFWVLAAALIGLKASGTTIGWGIQFQHPGFLIFLIVIVLGFAANMWGVYEIALPKFLNRIMMERKQEEPTFMGHFMTGAFAALLATPCTAPFLGTAVGFALARGAMEIFIIFSMIGVGLAAPYLLLAVVPGAFRFMPKPGMWMVKLRKGLALVLVLTAAWLGSVLVTISTTPTLDSGWEAFSEQRITELVEEGNVVFVDVTADWCLTCKANKRLVLARADIEEALSGPEIVKMQADWTQRDETILKFLQKHGRYGIPFNIVYGPAALEGVTLPELLSKKAVLHALSEAAGE